MKLASYLRPDGTAGWGAVVQDGVADFAATAPSLREALARGIALAEVPCAAPDYDLGEVTFLPPIPDPEKILCVGLNYASHIAETGREPPERPAIFVRFANSQVGHGQPLIRPKASNNFDYEGELAVVIGRRCRHVRRPEAGEVIAGYSCYNDGSIRDWQRHTIQFTPGKNFVASGSFGPWLVTPEEAGDIADATLITRLNGQEVQHAPISDLVFDVPAIIEYCSTFTELAPGDVLVTGTPSGVGAQREPPLWMKPGDAVEVEIDRIGVLRNPVEQEA